VEEYLPVGTIVILKNSNQKIMITGYFGSDTNKVLYEYNGCIYPEGLIDSNKGILFNHKSIKEIIYSGLKDGEYEEFSKKIWNLSKQYTNIILATSAKIMNNYLGGGKNG
jgi:hypothetical protein